MDGDEDLVAQIQQACRTPLQDEVSLCRLMRNPVRKVLDYSGAVVQLQAVRMPICIIGFDVTPRFLRALRIAAHSLEGRTLLSKARLDGPLAVHVDRLSALPLGPSLRPLVQGHLLVHDHTDPVQGSRSVFAFIGIRKKSMESVRHVLKAIAPALHRVFLTVHESHGSVLATLTPAEKAISQLLLNGARNKEIARTLGKSDATVRNQVHALFAKLEVGTRAAAATKLLAMETALSGPSENSVGWSQVAKNIGAIEHLFY